MTKNGLDAASWCYFSGGCEVSRPALCHKQAAITLTASKLVVLESIAKPWDTHACSPARLYTSTSRCRLEAVWVVGWLGGCTAGILHAGMAGRVPS